MMSFSKMNAEQTVWRGGRPGTPEGASWEQLRLMGVRRIISLESGWYEMLSGQVYGEDRLAMALEDRYRFQVEHYPLSDFLAPKESYVRSIVARISDGTPTYFHCLHGKDRTGYVAAAFRMLVQKECFEGACGEMLALGFHRFPYFFWQPSLKRFVS